MDTVATGTPAGICTMESRESMPSRCFSGTGTPITGSGVREASMPGRWAETTSTSTSIPNSASASSAARITG